MNYRNINRFIDWEPRTYIRERNHAKFLPFRIFLFPSCLTWCFLFKDFDDRQQWTWSIIHLSIFLMENYCGAHYNREYPIFYHFFWAKTFDMCIIHDHLTTKINGCWTEGVITNKLKYYGRKNHKSKQVWYNYRKHQTSEWIFIFSLMRNYYPPYWKMKYGKSRGKLHHANNVVEYKYNGSKSHSFCSLLSWCPPTPDEYSCMHSNVLSSNQNEGIALLLSKS